MLEQEVDSARHLIEIAIFKFCRQSKVQGQRACLQDEHVDSQCPTTIAVTAPDNWARQYTSLVLQRYMDLDETLATDQPLPTDIVDAYKDAVLTALQGILVVTTVILTCRIPSKSVPSLVLCHDRVA